MPVTDHRYLTAKDAHAVINSKVAMELRKNRVTLRAEYFSDCRTCPTCCGAIRKPEPPLPVTSGA